MSDALAVQNGQQLAPMQMIQLAFETAIKQGSAMEVVDRILDHQKWMIQHDEEEAFNAALKRIQTKLQKIQKRGYNKETKSWFARSADVDDEIQARVDEEGMTLNFEPGDPENPDEVLIIGVLALGAFSKRYPLPMPADGKGAKGGGVMSRTHATGAAITYGKRYLKNMIFDLRFEEIDDDGNSASGSRIAREKVGEWLKNITEAPDMAELKKVFGKAYNAANELGDKNALDIIGPAYEARKDQLNGSSQG